MKKTIGVLMLSFLPALAMAGPHEAEAERLLQLSGAKAGMDSMTDLMLQQQLQQNPTLLPFEPTMREFFNKYLSYDVLKDDFIAIYVDSFTIDELKELNSFYASEVGQKATRMLPELMQKGGEIGARQVQQNIGELQQMIQAEAERLRAQQGQ